MKNLAISILSCFILVQEAFGHGNETFCDYNLQNDILLLQHLSFSGAMYYPNPWWATNECSPDENPESCGFDMNAGDLGCEGRCRNSMGLTAFFTNYTVVEKRTLPKEFLDADTTNKSPAGKHPWNSPGAAPIFGNGCGANGGNPNGCIGEGE